MSAHRHHHDHPDCDRCEVDRAREAFIDAKEKMMSDFSGFTAASDRLTTALTNLDTREAAETAGNQAIIDKATASLTAAADHVDAMDPGTKPAAVAFDPASNKALYEFTGADPATIDATVWTAATVDANAAGGQLYTFANDTPGAQPTGAGAEWKPWTGATVPDPAGP